MLETTFSTATGSVMLTEALCVGPDNTGHLLGKGAPHLFVRRLACTDGEVEVDYVPRPEYGLIRPILGHTDSGITARGGAEWLVLTHHPVPLVVERAHATGRASLHAGDVLHLGLHRSTLEQAPARVWSPADLADRLDATVAVWRSWSGLHQQYQGPWADLVHHSGRVLQGLTFQPSGAIVAAATTSLPRRQR